MNTADAYERTEPSAMDADDDLSQYLAFTLEDVLYCLPLERVREIIQYREIATVPMMPDCVRGVINLRGNVIPVIDLAERFGGRSRALGKRSVILILETTVGEHRQTYGLIVDSVSEVLALAATEVEQAPMFGTGLRTEFIAGVARRQNTIMLILEVDTILAVSN